MEQNLNQAFVVEARLTVTRVGVPWAFLAHAGAISSNKMRVQNSPFPSPIPPCSCSSDGLNYISH
jgi:hypothetical protein